MDCEICTHKPESVPYIVHESAMARQERNNRRVWILVIILIALVALLAVQLMWVETQFEVTETTIEQDTDGGGDNYVVGGDYNGEAENHNKEANP